MLISNKFESQKIVLRAYSRIYVVSEAVLVSRIVQICKYYQLKESGEFNSQRFNTQYAKHWPHQTNLPVTDTLFFIRTFQLGLGKKLRISLG